MQRQTKTKLATVQRLIKEGKSITAACREARLSPTTYHRVTALTPTDRSATGKPGRLAIVFGSPSDVAQVLANLGLS